MEEKEVVLNPLHCRVKSGTEQKAFFSVINKTGRVFINQDAVKELKLEEGSRLMFKKGGEHFFVKLGENEGQPLKMLHAGSFELCNKGFVKQVLILLKPTVPKEHQEILIGAKWQILIEPNVDGWHGLFGLIKLLAE